MRGGEFVTMPKTGLGACENLAFAVGSSEEQVERGFDPAIGGQGCLELRGPKALVRVCRSVGQVLAAKNEITASLRAHRSGHGEVRKGEKPAGSQGPARPIGLGFEVALEGVDTVPGLKNRVDLPAPGGVTLPPFPLGERHMAALHLDHRGAAIGHEDEQVDLDLAVCGVGESHAVKQYVAVAQLGPECLPDDLLRLVLEIRMLRNEQCWHVPPFDRASCGAAHLLRHPASVR